MQGNSKEETDMPGHHQCYQLAGNQQAWHEFLFFYITTQPTGSSLLRARGRRYVIRELPGYRSVGNGYHEPAAVLLYLDIYLMMTPWLPTNVTSRLHYLGGDAQKE